MDNSSCVVGFEVSLCSDGTPSSGFGCSSEHKHACKRSCNKDNDCYCSYLPFYGKLTFGRLMIVMLFSPRKFPFCGCSKFCVSHLWIGKFGLLWDTGYGENGTFRLVVVAATAVGSCYVDWLSASFKCGFARLGHAVSLLRIRVFGYILAC